MAFYKDYDYTLDGNTVTFKKGATINAVSLPPEQGLKLQFHAIDGMLEIGVAAYDIRERSRFQIPGGHHIDPGGVGPVEEFNLVSVKIELFAPAQSVPAATWVTKSEWSTTDGVSFEHSVGGSGSPWIPWECHVTNLGSVPAEVYFGVGYVFDRKPLITKPIALSLLDHTYEVILDALTVVADINGNTVELSFGSELRRFFGTSQPAILKTISHPLPSGVQGTGSLRSLELEACSGKQLLEAMRERYQRVDTAYKQALAQAQVSAVSDSTTIQLLEQSIAKNNEWKQGWETRMNANLLTIHAMVAFTDIHLDRELDYLVGRTDVDIADIEDAVVHVFLAFDPSLQESFVLVLSPVRVTGGLAELAADLGFIPEVNEIAESFLTSHIESAAAPLGRYLGEALGHLCARDSVFMGVRADDSAWHVQYTAVPAEVVGIHTTHGGAGAGDVVLEGPQAGGSSGGNSTSTSTPTPTGQMPPEFIVGSQEALARLDKIKNIVVVMMENRSFDHMLGYLRLSRGPSYDGVKGGENNTVTNRSQPVWLRRARDVVPDPPITRILVGPEHGFEHVKKQIAGGAMTGFAQDYEDSHPTNAEMVMTYYTGDELKTYDQLAASYAVCDRWFAAHPGPTWPNRWTTMSGTTPELENPNNNDPRLGFLPQFTIFDLLAMHGIEWRLFESDLSLIRTYDRYRLDSTNIIPLRNRRDPSRNFAEVAKRGELPPIVFVEPNFSDIPPLSSANDDLVPVDLRRGQNFIAEIFNDLLADLPQRDHMLFIITYDEHGGFYDHVPPPGTDLGPAEWKGRVPRIHPQGADNMGVRVPAIVVSPWVSAGSVCKEVFDHTSIIKTILLHQRTHFSADDFTQFGPRVNQANHVGLALDLDTARTDWPAEITRMGRRPSERVNPGQRPSQGAHLNDLHETLRRVFLPRPA